ncbi:hypothetical protein SDC9_11668 [bioreactor metagenome]|uniref:Uncharacterized protein n=1 Tax=bioreactor metagenome TaxID=1076179 RepID=A0A644TGL5_9ZZZZ
MIKTFLSPRFVGKRFENHSIPFSMFEDLASFQKIILEVAKWQYKKANPQKARLPKGFVDSFNISLSRIRKGSARLVMVRDYENPEFGFDDVFDKSRNILMQLFKKTGEKKALVAPPGFPNAIIDEFENFGRTLRADEAIYFPGCTRGSVYNSEVRKVILASRAEAKTERGVIRGNVYEVNRDAMSFSLHSNKGSLTGFYTEAIQDKILEAFNEKYGYPILVEADLTYDVRGKVKKAENISKAEIVDFKNMKDRIDDLIEMGDSWPITNYPKELKVRLKNFMEKWEAHADPKMENPCIFPMDPDGIQVDWTDGSRHLTIEISLNDLKGELALQDTSTDQYEESSINLSSLSSWKIINDYALTYTSRIING